jgi:hypothetical protein
MEKKCFVAMPFDGSCDRPYYKAILPACSESGIKPWRVDADLSEKNILRQVVSGIYEADLVIANITGANPNVFYELGISHTLPYPNRTIVIAKEGTTIPFDIHSYKVVVYNESSKGLKVLKEQLKARISRLVSGSGDSSNPVQDYIGYYDGLVMSQEDATERHKITLHNAFQVSRYTLILFGTTLYSIRSAFSLQQIKEKIQKPEFRELSLVMRDPRARDVRESTSRYLDAFITDENITELFEFNKRGPKVFLYLCQDFIRFSATYIDHSEEFGKIRIAHSIYGSLMENAPSYLLTRKRTPRLYETFIHSWEDLKSRDGTKKIASGAELQSFRQSIKSKKK